MFHYGSVLVISVALSPAATGQTDEDLEHSETGTPEHCYLKRCGTLQEFAKPSVTSIAFRRLPYEDGVEKNANDKLDLAQLREHLREKPRTKAGQVRQAWPDIKQLLDAGHSLKDVCQWLNEIGLQIGYARLSDYICQLRRHERVLVNSGDIALHSDRAVTAETAPHPLAHIVERENKRVGFDYNAEPDPKKLI